MSANDSDSYKVVVTNVIDAVAQVRIYDETISHIGREHPELRNFIPSLEHAIHDTIRNPTEVRQSNVDLHVNSYKFCSSNHLMGNNFLVVPVKVVEGTSSLLKTAYFSDSVSGSVVWSSEHD